MKNLVKVIMLLVVSSASIKLNAQFGMPSVVTDPGVNSKLSSQGIIQNIMKGLQQTSNNIQGNTLTKATETAGTVKNQLNLLETALNVADAFSKSQMMKDFFIEQQRVMNRINTIARELMVIQNFPPVARNVISTSSINQIKSNTQDAVVLLSKSWNVLMNSLVSKQLNLSDRMVFLNEAQNYVKQANLKIDLALSVIQQKKEAGKKIVDAKTIYTTVL